jgi:hypothetical protein
MSQFIVYGLRLLGFEDVDYITHTVIPTNVIDPTNVIEMSLFLLRADLIDNDHEGIHEGGILLIFRDPYPPNQP